MHLLIVSLYELKQFLQIILWIAIPATVAAMIITTFLHYRYKRKTASEENFTGEGASVVMASEVQTPVSEDEYRDMLLMHKKFTLEIENGQQKYDQLKDEFRKLEKKHLELIAKGQSPTGDNNVNHLQKQAREYEQKIVRLEQALEYMRKEEMDRGTISGWQEQVRQKERDLENRDTLVSQLEEGIRIEREQKKSHAAEINKLGNLLKDMEMMATKTSQEKEQELQEQKDLNALLEKQLQQISAMPVKDHSQQLAAMQEGLAMAQEEKTNLKSRLLEQDSMLDVMAEKNLQISFLQNQLEQRIKSYHQLEYQTIEDVNRLKDLQALSTGLEHQAKSLADELQERNEEAVQLRDKLHITLQEQTTLQESYDSKISHIDQLESRLNIVMKEQKQDQETLYSKTSHIDLLEATLRELTEQNTQMILQLKGSQESIELLNGKLFAETHRAKDLEHKLEISSQLQVKIYKELAKSLGVALMQFPQESDYMNNETIKEWVFTEPLSGSIAHELAGIE
jgi:chromosome segregation ATPase